MLTRRLIACLDVRDGRVVKGVEFEGLRDVGDPVELAVRYETQGADEICFLDITASHEARKTLLDVVRRTSERLFIPLTVGGGVRDVQDVAQVLRAGADKVSINSALVPDPTWLGDAADRFGSQSVVASIDGKRVNGAWSVYTHGGRTPTDLDAVEWARTCVASGAGEILLTSMDRDGTRKGYDISFTRAVSDAVGVPVIASGGAGTAVHLREAIEDGGADAVLLAGILHDDEVTLTRLKREMADAGLLIRSNS